MGDLWLAGSEHRQVHDGWNMDGGRVAVLHHITYDELNPDGTRRVSTSGLANYLNDKGYQPHVVIDPFTGEAISLLPADVGGSAIRANNHSGSILYQIEWVFTPGTVYNGVRYDSLPDTPMLGLDRVMALAASWGIPPVVPLPRNDRNADVFLNQDGHYGHCNAPVPDDHSDPECDVRGIVNKAVQPPVPEVRKDEDVALIWHKGGVYLISGGKVSKWGLQPRAVDAIKASAKIEVGGNPNDDQSNLIDSLR